MSLKPDLLLSVLNKLSAKALSLLTLGLLNEGVIPSDCMVASMVEPFIGEPLSLCKTRMSPGLICPASVALRISSLECSAVCSGLVHIFLILTHAD